MELSWGRHCQLPVSKSCLRNTKLGTSNRKLFNGYAALASSAHLCTKPTYERPLAENATIATSSGNIASLLVLALSGRAIHDGDRAQYTDNPFPICVKASEEPYNAVPSLKRQ